MLQLISRSTGGRHDLGAVGKQDIATNNNAHCNTSRRQVITQQALSNVLPLVIVCHCIGNQQVIGEQSASKALQH